MFLFFFLFSSLPCRISGDGRIIIVTNEIVACKEVLTIQLAGERLDKKDFFGKSDPFLEIFRANQLDGGPRSE